MNRLVKTSPDVVVVVDAAAVVVDDLVGGGDVDPFIPVVDFWFARDPIKGDFNANLRAWDMGEKSNGETIQSGLGDSEEDDSSLRGELAKLMFSGTA